MLLHKYPAAFLFTSDDRTIVALYYHCQSHNNNLLKFRQFVSTTFRRAQQKPHPGARQEAICKRKKRSTLLACTWEIAEKTQRLQDRKTLGRESTQAPELRCRLLFTHTACCFILLHLLNSFTASRRTESVARLTSATVVDLIDRILQSVALKLASP